ncbi:T9SS type A sorting domain-containing protein [Fulvivirgaceae bacterium BMA10]|uniref:T9SS type A sorting domain-containing protein n=1 Tax=Splendidivirga corallicola TaxID=3051826 RepID=A0ABT8KQT8_9BACT|nr:T9SS type A sorting domain-containing protein [Fulvivirgaceae bacterium BMA10]
MKKHYTARFCSLTVFFALGILIHLSLVQTASAQTEDCPDGMEHYYKFDETSVVTVVDLYGNNASCTNCPTSTTGLIDGAFLFDGTDDQIEIPDDDSFDWLSAESFSIELWVKPDDVTPSDNQVFIGRDDNWPDLHWWIGMNTSGQPTFTLGNQSMSSPSIVGGSALSQAQWNHIVAVRDATGGQITLYVNGTQVAQAAQSYSNDWIGTNIPITVGNLTTGGNTFPFLGSIDNVALYGKALSITEVQSLRDKGLAGNAHCTTAASITSTAVTQATVGEAYSYTVEATGAPTPTFSLDNSPTGMTINETTGVIDWTPVDGQQGDHTVIVRASNAVGDDTQEFTISVGINNAPPSYTSGGSLTVDEDAGSQTAAAWATDIDDGDPELTQVLTFNVSTNNDALFSTLPSIDSNSGDLTYTPADNANGMAVVTVSLSDDGGEQTGESFFTITVDAVNDAPSFTKGADQTANDSDGQQTVTGWATDINDGDPEASQTLTFEITSNTNEDLFDVQPAVNTNGDLTYTPKTGADGTAAITLHLTDNGDGTAPNVNQSESATFNITINNVTAIDKTDISSTLSVYPNPSIEYNTNLKMENDIIGDLNIEIFDLSGKSYYFNTIAKKRNSLELQLPTRSLPAGMYIIKLNNDRVVAEQKFLKY